MNNKTILIIAVLLLAFFLVNKNKKKDPATAKPENANNDDVLQDVKNVIDPLAPGTGGHKPLKPITQAVTRAYPEKNPVREMKLIDMTFIPNPNPTFSPAPVTMGAGELTPKQSYLL